MRVLPTIRQHALHRRHHAIHDRTEVARVGGGLPAQFGECRGDRPAQRMPEHDHEARAELRGGKFDAADLRRRDDVAGDADHEQIAEALIEHELRRHARVGTPENDGERLLRRHLNRAPHAARRARRDRLALDESAVPVT